MSLRVHLRAFVRDPKGVAALVPTSRASVRRIVNKVPTADARLIVEYGPGSGVLTRAILDRLPADARLLAVEANAELAARLSERLEDPRLIVVRDTAARVREILAEHRLGPADCVLSGIPFFWIEPEQALEIVRATHAVLAPGGTFLTYQMFYQPRGRLAVHLERCFSTVRSQLDLTNLPPQRLYEAVR